MTPGQQRGRAHRARGFSLIELMIAMLLGLIVIGGVTSVFLAGQQAYRANEALSDVQEGSRTAFEMLTRDLRDVGFTGCDNTSGRVANVINNNATLWYANWAMPLQGYDDASKDPALAGLTQGVPVAGQSSVRVLGTVNTDVTVGNASGNPNAFNINAASTQLSAGQIIMVCDFDHATLMQVTTYAGTSVGFTTASTPAPGNCSAGLGYPTVCTATGNAYTFLPNARINLLTASDWYIGTNLLGGKSLYRLVVSFTAAGASVGAPQEMVRNVNSMTIKFLQSGGTSFVNAATVAGNWGAVNAAQVTLSVVSTNQKASVDTTSALTRQFVSTATMRNRVQ